MYSLNRMEGFNKSLCNNRQYGTNPLALKNTQQNMVLKPEYLGNDHFKFLNNFGLQPHLITDKKFADITSVKTQPRNNFPTSYNTTPMTNMGRTEHLKKADVIPLPAAALEMPEASIAEAKPNGRSCKKAKRKRKRGGHANCKSSPSKPWHKTSLKFEIMETEELSQDKTMEAPVTPFEVLENPVNVVEPQCSVSPIKLLQALPKTERCRALRLPSECESEDSFIVFDSSSNSFDMDIEELDEYHYSTSDECDDEDDDEECSFVSSLDDVWPTKRVRFADDKDLCEVHPMVQWSFAYQKARKGPWEQYALDRTRFQRRVTDSESILNTILQPEHRNKIYNERFLEGNS